jgi:hypothetical protein
MRTFDQNRITWRTGAVNSYRDRSQDRQRFLIVGTGRSGSTLLAGILAQAGANFAMAKVTSWDPKSGEYEHPLIHSARRWQSRAQKVRESLLPDVLLYRFCERRMQRDLQTLLDAAQYVKSTDLVWLVHPIYRLSFWPRVIVSYRPFVDYARSRFLRYGWDMPHLVQAYRDAYSTAALQLQAYGGCAINLDDLLDLEQIAWAGALAQLTGIEQDRLLRSRAELVNKRKLPDKPPLFDMTIMDASIIPLYEAFERLRGQVIEPD